MKFKKLSTNWKIYAILLIILFAALLRFYQLSQTFVFTIDEEYHAVLAQSIIDNFHIKLIGVSVSTGLYLGPLWTYFTALLLYAFQSNILSLGYAAASVGVLTTLLTFYTGYKLFNFRVGFISSLLYATLPLIVFFDQKYWNDTLVPAFSLSILLSLSQTKKSPFWWIVLAAVFGLMFHTHFSAFPLIILVAIVFIKNWHQIPLKIIIFSLLTFFIFISPLVIFGMTHQWVNVPTPSKFINTPNKNDTNLKESLAHHWQVLFLTLGRINYLNLHSANADETNWGCTTSSSKSVDKKIDSITTWSKPPLWASCLTLAIILWFILRKSTWKSTHRCYLAVSILLLLTFFLILPSDPLEYYLLGVFPLLTFLPALIYEDANKSYKKIVLLPIVVLVLSSIYTVINVDSSLGMGARKKLVTEVMNKVGENTFRVNEYGGCHQSAGWRYIFKAFGREPNQASVDYFLGWAYPEKITPGSMKYTVNIFESRLYPNVKTREGIICKGGFCADIIKNY